MFNHAYAQNICLQQCNIEVTQGSVLSLVTAIALHPIYQDTFFF